MTCLFASYLPEDVLRVRWSFGLLAQWRRGSLLQNSQELLWFSLLSELLIGNSKQYYWCAAVGSGGVST